MIEFADIKDKKELSDLWHTVFQEDMSVIDDFFESVFPSTTAPIIRINGEIASALFLLPCGAGDFNGKCVYCAMTRKSCRGKGYMRRLLDFSYDHCINHGFDFLFLVPAEPSLFDYYGKCGFVPFGTASKYIFGNGIPVEKEKPEFDCELSFDSSVLQYWERACITYGGEKASFGLVSDDGTAVIRNADCDLADIPDRYKSDGNVIQGKISFGEAYIPAMIKTDIEEIKNMKCYVGITLE